MFGLRLSSTFPAFPCLVHCLSLTSRCLSPLTASHLSLPFTGAACVVFVVAGLAVRNSHCRHRHVHATAFAHDRRVLHRICTQWWWWVSAGRRGEGGRWRTDRGCAIEQVGGSEERTLFGCRRSNIFHYLLGTSWSAPSQPCLPSRRRAPSPVCSYLVSSSMRPDVNRSAPQVRPGEAAVRSVTVGDENLTTHENLTNAHTFSLYTSENRTWIHVHRTEQSRTPVDVDVYLSGRGRGRGRGRHNSVIVNNLRWNAVPSPHSQCCGPTGTAPASHAIFELHAVSFGTCLVWKRQV